MDEIIKRLENLEYGINGSDLDLKIIRNQLGVLVAIIGDIAIKITKMEGRAGINGNDTQKSRRSGSGDCGAEGLKPGSADDY